MKIGITIVTHHKPFLIKSSLNSLSSQSFKNYDLNIVILCLTSITRASIATIF